MLRSFVLSFLTFMLAASPGLGQQEGSYKGVFFSAPSGWSSGEQEGSFLLVPDTHLSSLLFRCNEGGGSISAPDRINSRLVYLGEKLFDMLKVLLRFGYFYRF